MTPKKEGFGPTGKWVWVPTGGATVLKLVVDNPAMAPPPPKSIRATKFHARRLKKLEDGSS